MCRIVHATCVRLQPSQLHARPRDGVHPRERERAEIGVERVYRLPSCGVFGNQGDELRGYLHVPESVDKLEFALEQLDIVNNDRTTTAEDVWDDTVNTGQCERSRR